MSSMANDAAMNAALAAASDMGLGPSTDGPNSPQGKTTSGSKRRGAQPGASNKRSPAGLPSSGGDDEEDSPTHRARAAALDEQSDEEAKTDPVAFYKELEVKARVLDVWVAHKPPMVVNNACAALVNAVPIKKIRRRVGVIPFGYKGPDKELQDINAFSGLITPEQLFVGLKSARVGTPVARLIDEADNWACFEVHADDFDRAACLAARKAELERIARGGKAAYEVTPTSGLVDGRPVDAAVLSGEVAPLSAVVDDPPKALTAPTGPVGLDLKSAEAAGAPPPKSKGPQAQTCADRGGLPRMAAPDRANLLTFNVRVPVGRTDALEAHAARYYPNAAIEWGANAYYQHPLLRTDRWVAGACAMSMALKLRPKRLGSFFERKRRAGQYYEGARVQCVHPMYTPSDVAGDEDLLRELVSGDVSEEPADGTCRCAHDETCVRCCDIDVAVVMHSMYYLDSRKIQELFTARPQLKVIYSIEHDFGAAMSGELYPVKDSKPELSFALRAATEREVETWNTVAMHDVYTDDVRPSYSQPVLDRSSLIPCSDDEVISRSARCCVGEHTHIYSYVRVPIHMLAGRPDAQHDTPPKGVMVTPPRAAHSTFVNGQEVRVPARPAIAMTRDLMTKAAKATVRNANDLIRAGGALKAYAAVVAPENAAEVAEALLEHTVDGNVRSAAAMSRIVKSSAMEVIHAGYAVPARATSLAWRGLSSVAQVASNTAQAVVAATVNGFETEARAQEADISTGSRTALTSKVAGILSQWAVSLWGEDGSSAAPLLTPENLCIQNDRLYIRDPGLYAPFFDAPAPTDASIDVDVSCYTLSATIRAFQDRFAAAHAARTLAPRARWSKSCEVNMAAARFVRNNALVAAAIAAMPAEDKDEVPFQFLVLRAMGGKNGACRPSYKQIDRGDRFVVFRPNGFVAAISDDAGPRFAWCNDVYRAGMLGNTPYRSDVLCVTEYSDDIVYMRGEEKMPAEEQAKNNVTKLDIEATQSWNGYGETELGPGSRPRGTWPAFSSGSWWGWATYHAHVSKLWGSFRPASALYDASWVNVFIVAVFALGMYSLAALGYYAIASNPGAAAAFTDAWSAFRRPYDWWTGPSPDAFDTLPPVLADPTRATYAVVLSSLRAMGWVAPAASTAHFIRAWLWFVLSLGALVLSTVRAREDRRGWTAIHVCVVAPITEEVMYYFFWPARVCICLWEILETYPTVEPDRRSAFVKRKIRTHGTLMFIQLLTGYSFASYLWHLAGNCGVTWVAMVDQADARARARAEAVADQAAAIARARRRAARAFEDAAAPILRDADCRKALRLLADREGPAGLFALNALLQDVAVEDDHSYDAQGAEAVPEGTGLPSTVVHKFVEPSRVLSLRAPDEDERRTEQPPDVLLTLASTHPALNPLADGMGSLTRAMGGGAWYRHSAEYKALRARLRVTVARVARGVSEPLEPTEFINRRSADGTLVYSTEKRRELALAEDAVTFGLAPAMAMKNEPKREVLLALWKAVNERSITHPGPTAAVMYGPTTAWRFEVYKEAVRELWRDRIVIASGLRDEQIGAEHSRLLDGGNCVALSADGSKADSQVSMEDHRESFLDAAAAGCDREYLHSRVALKAAKIYGRADMRLTVDGTLASGVDETSMLQTMRHLTAVALLLERGFIEGAMVYSDDLVLYVKPTVVIDPRPVLASVAATEANVVIEFDDQPAFLSKMFVRCTPRYVTNADGELVSQEHALVLQPGRVLARSGFIMQSKLRRDSREVAVRAAGDAFRLRASEPIVRDYYAAVFRAGGHKTPEVEVDPVIEEECRALFGITPEMEALARDALASVVSFPSVFGFHGCSYLVQQASGASQRTFSNPSPPLAPQTLSFASQTTFHDHPSFDNHQTTEIMSSRVPPLLDPAVGADPVAYWQDQQRNPVLARAAELVQQTRARKQPGEFTVGTGFRGGLRNVIDFLFPVECAPRARKGGMSSSKPARAGRKVSVGGGKHITIVVAPPAPAAKRKAAGSKKARRKAAGGGRTLAPRQGSQAMLSSGLMAAAQVTMGGAGYKPAPPPVSVPLAIAAVEDRQMDDAKRLIACRYAPFSNPPARAPQLTACPSALSQSVQQFMSLTTACTVGGSTEHRGALVFTPGATAANYVAVMNPANGEITSWTAQNSWNLSFLLANAVLVRPVGMAAKIENLTQFANAGGSISFSRLPTGMVATGPIFGTFLGLPMTKIYAGADLAALDAHIATWVGTASNAIENLSPPSTVIQNTVIYVEIRAPAATSLAITQVSNMEYLPAAGSSSSVAVDTCIGSGAEVGKLVEVIADQTGNPNTADFADRAQDVVAAVCSGLRTAAKVANTAGRVWGIAKSAWSMAKGFLGDEVHNGWVRAGSPFPAPPDVVLVDHHEIYVRAMADALGRPFTMREWYAMQHPAIEAHIHALRAERREVRRELAQSADGGLHTVADGDHEDSDDDADVDDAASAAARSVARSEARSAAARASRGPAPRPF